VVLGAFEFTLSLTEVTITKSEQSSNVVDAFREESFMQFFGTLCAPKMVPVISAFTSIAEAVVAKTAIRRRRSFIVRVGKICYALVGSLLLTVL
jgi:hypothetical protein